MRSVSLMKGFTLTELMIVAALSIGLCTLSIQLLLTAKKAIMQQHALVRVHNNQQAFSWVLSQAVYQAGQLPCSTLRTNLSWQANQPKQFDQLVANRGIDIVYPSAVKSIPWLTKNWQARLAPHLPLIWLSFTEQSYPLLDSFQVEQPMLVTQGNIHWTRGNWLIIDDGIKVSLVQVDKDIRCYANQKTCSVMVRPFKQALSHLYHPGAQVALLESNLYFIASSQRFNQDDQTIFSLYESRLNGDTQEILEGVDDWTVSWLTKHTSTSSPIGLSIYVSLNSIEPAWVTSKKRFSVHQQHHDRRLNRTAEFNWMFRSWA